MKRLMLVLLVFGAVLSYLGIGGIIDNSKPVKDFGNVKVSDLKAGMIVAGDIEYNLGCFEESYRTRNGAKSGSSTYYYAVMLDGKVIGVSCGSSYKSAFDNQLNKLLTGGGAAIPKIPLKGKVKKMNSETKGYLDEYLTYDGPGKVAEVAPFVITITMISMKSSIGLAIGGIICLLIPILILIKGLKAGSSYKATPTSNTASSYGTDDSSYGMTDSSNSGMDSSYASADEGSFSDSAGSYGSDE